MKALVAVEASPTSEAALDAASLLDDEVELHVLNVAAPEERALTAIGALASTADPGIDVAARPAEIRRATELARAGAAAISGEPLVALGDPVERILATAARLDVDLIVIGSNDKGPLERLLTGSVSRQVLESADCSVLIAR